MSHRGWNRLATPFRRWGVTARSAATSAAVVLIAFTAASVGLIVVLHQSLIAGIDDTVAVRTANIVAALERLPARDLAPGLFTIDQRVVGVEITDADGRVVRGAADTGSRADARVGTQTAATDRGTYTVVVRGGTAAVDSTVRRVAGLLAVAAFPVGAVAAAVSYVMVKRSLRSVEAMRTQVADISATQLGGRVPVPPSRDEIHTLAVTMNDMLDRIESSQTAQRRFVGDASTELRHPLDTILATLNAVQAEPRLLDPDLTTNTLLPEAHRMKKLVEDLLLLARADEHGLSPRRERVSVDELISAETARLRREDRLAVTAESGDIHAWVDPVGLSRVLRNLLDNAAEHARSQISISAKHVAGHLELRVTDDGAGVPSADRTRVFTRFVRLDAAPNREGTGLGLPIVAEIVAAHGGTVSIDESPSGGAEVTVTLPSRK